MLESVKNCGTCTPTTTIMSRRTTSNPSSRTRLTRTTRRFPLMDDGVLAPCACSLVVVIGHLPCCCKHNFLLIRIRMGKLCADVPLMNDQDTISHR